MRGTRTGAAWEGMGFVLIVIGMITGMATGDANHFGGVIASVGVVLFLVGRFK